MRTLKGQCRCRAVTTAVADAFDYAVNCRRATVSAFEPLAGLPIGGLAGITVALGHAAAPYVHGRLCGSPLDAVVKGGAVAHVPMGTLVDAPSLRPTGHVPRRVGGRVVRGHGRPAPVPGVDPGGTTAARAEPAGPSPFPRTVRRGSLRPNGERR